MSRTQNALAVANRRKLVSSLYLMKMTQAEIAVALKDKGYDVNQSTVSRDIAKIQEEFQAEYKQNTKTFVYRELAGLDKLELEAYAMFNRAKKTKNTKEALSVIDTILRVNERRSKLLGLDKPDKLKIDAEHSGQLTINLIRASCKEELPETLRTITLSKKLEESPGGN